MGTSIRDFSPNSVGDFGGTYNGTFRRPSAVLFFCSPHPLRASSRVCYKQKTRSKSCGAKTTSCGEGGISYARSAVLTDPVRGASNKMRSAGTIVPSFVIPVHLGEQARHVPRNNKCPLSGALLILFAERAGFEPAIPFRVYTLSRRAPSTTRTPLQKNSVLNAFSVGDGPPKATNATGVTSAYRLPPPKNDRGRKSTISQPRFRIFFAHSASSPPPPPPQTTP